MAARQAMSSTERALARPVDVLHDAFNNAPVVEFWLDEKNDLVWAGEWTNYAQTDATRQETKTIQPAFVELAKKFPMTSPYEVVHTNKGWNKMTPDAMLFLRDAPRVDLSVAAIFEWVGQDEQGFPSKEHKAKFLRDCVRLYGRCGKQREVHGVISDLSRIVAVKFLGLDENGAPLVQKTAVYSGDRVRSILTAFAAASAVVLCVKKKAWEFPDLSSPGAAKRPNYSLQYGGSVLGSGLHGAVFRHATDATLFIKQEISNGVCQREYNILCKLSEHNVFCVPLARSLSKDGTAFMASPVGRPIEQLQGRSCVWTLGVRLLRCLQSVHQEAGLCHRDIRPSNMVFVPGERGDVQPFLIDWASATDASTVLNSFTGTVHYAAESVLQAVAKGEIPVPLPAHDLESLVYSIFDLSQEPDARPSVLAVNRRNTDAIIAGWQSELAVNKSLAKLVGLARSTNYAMLGQEFASKSCCRDLDSVLAEEE